MDQDNILKSLRISNHMFSVHSFWCAWNRKSCVFVDHGQFLVKTLSDLFAVLLTAVNIWKLQMHLDQNDYMQIRF